MKQCQSLWSLSVTLCCCRTRQTTVMCSKCWEISQHCYFTQIFVNMLSPVHLKHMLCVWRNINKKKKWEEENIFFCFSLEIIHFFSLLPWPYSGFPLFYAFHRDIQSATIFYKIESQFKRFHSVGWKNLICLTFKFAIYSKRVVDYCGKSIQLFLCRQMPIRMKIWWEMNGIWDVNLLRFLIICWFLGWETDKGSL